MSSSMALFRAAGGLRASTLRRYVRPTAAPVTAPAPASSFSRYAATAAAEHQTGSKLPRGDYVPVYVALGMVAVSATLGLHTARHQLERAPNVWVDKRKREAVPEVTAPEVALEDAERFVDKSLFRKVAHVQDDRSLAAGVVADPVAAEHPVVRKAVTLRDVGVETPGIEQGREGLLDKIFKKNHA